MKVITWNVNGIRTKIFNKLSSAKISKENEIFPDAVSPISNILKLDPDFICLQETRCSEINGKKFNIKGYNSVFNESKHEQQARNANRYSGTCIFYKETFKPIGIEYQIPGYNDDEGRIIILHFEQFILINVYTPNSGTNFNNRLLWQEAMLNFFKNTNKKIIYSGDMNVAWRDEDVHFKLKDSPTFSQITPLDAVGFLPEERLFIPELIKLGFVDSYITQEHKYSNRDGFTYWDSRSRKKSGIPGARYDKLGWRIDYNFVRGFVTQDSYAMNIIGTEYINEGESQCSDHCPVFCEIF